VRRWRRHAGALGLALSACTGPHFELSELPEAPIAFVYRTVRETERVQEFLEQEQKRGGRGGPRNPLEAEARRLEQTDTNKLEIRGETLEELAGLRRPEDALRDQAGRVRFYVAPAGRLERVEFAPRGARPLEWSPDHRRLLFSALSGDRLQLFEWLAETGEVRQLTRGESHPDGCYGPDGALAYAESVRARNGRITSRIWIRLPGERARPVTEGPADLQPTWSPDGRRLVYAARDRSRGEMLRWVDPASGEGGVLTRGRSPVFAPDGEWIVYSARTAAGWKLWRMRPDGSARRSFGASAFHENDPAVSPDGRFVVFAGTKQERSATSRLFVRPLDGTADRQLELSGTGMLPVW